MTFISIVIIIIIIYFIYNCYLEDYSKLKWYVGTTFSREAENVTELDSCYLKSLSFSNNNSNKCHYVIHIFTHLHVALIILRLKA